MHIHRYEFTIKMDEPAVLPQYKGSMFRGAFGWAFRKAVCVTGRQECNGCILQNVCSYFRVFETEMPPDTEIYFMKGVQKMPHPYILVPPLDSRREFSRGDELTVSLTLFGKFAELLPFFVYSFQQMGITGIGASRYCFSLEQVNVLTPLGLPKMIFSSGKPDLRSEQHPVIVSEMPPLPIPASVTLQFLTPYRAQLEGTIITRPEEITADLLLNAIRRRYIVIETLYGNAENTDATDINHEGVFVSENNLVFKNWERYSNRQQTKMSMGGMSGSITLSGNLSPYWLLIRIGELMHIGKNAVFGLGKYKIIPHY